MSIRPEYLMSMARVAIPVIAANAVPLVGVLGYGWSILAVFMLYCTEMLAIVVFTATLFVVRAPPTFAGRYQAIVDALGAIIVCGSLVAGFAWMAMAVIGEGELGSMPRSGHLHGDILLYISRLDLAVAVAIVISVQLAAFLAALGDGARKRRLGEANTDYGAATLFARMTAMVAIAMLLIFASTSAPPGQDLSTWSVTVLVVMKAAIDSWIAWATRPRRIVSATVRGP